MLAGRLVGLFVSGPIFWLIYAASLALRSPLPPPILAALPVPLLAFGYWVGPYFAAPAGGSVKTTQCFFAVGCTDSDLRSLFPANRTSLGTCIMIFSLVGRKRAT